MNWHRSRGIQRLALTGAVSASILALPGCAGFLKQSYPPLTMTDDLAMVSAPVEIHLDAFGVPHIFAQNQDDAAAALGFLHVRDRGFQLEMIRLASQGRLTEFLGKDLLQTDRRLRLLTYRLDESVLMLPEADRRRLDAYCQGINRALTLMPTPAEFKIKKHTPAPWTLRDVVAVGRLQSWDLAGDAALEGLRDQLSAVVKPEVLDWLLTPSLHLGTPALEPSEAAAERPPLPPTAPPPAGLDLITPWPTVQAGMRPERPNAAERRAGLVAGGDQFLPAARPPLTDNELFALAEGVEDWIAAAREGSNAWAVAGNRTASGKPILAGDPHLDLPFPPLFYEVHLSVPDLELSGATFPGMPMVVIGHSQHIAWSLTTCYSDSQDLFRLSVDDQDPRQYRVDGALEAFTLVPQEYRWGSGSDEVLVEPMRVSRFGPIYNPGREDRLRPDATYAIAWAGLGAASLPMASAFDQLARATTPEAARDAIVQLRIPNQNWTFATASGQIGYVLGGALPNRRASALPRDGSTGASLWSGFLEEYERPVRFNPPEGFIVTANQPLLRDVTRFQTYASGSYRGLRITTVLESRSDWTPQNLRGLQVDPVNLEAARFIRLLSPAWKTSPPTGLDGASLERLEALLGLLERWDASMGTESAEALIYETWRQQLHQMLFSRHVADATLLTRMLEERISEAPLEIALFSPDGARWWDDPRTAEIETRDQTLVSAFLKAEEMLRSTHGKDVSSWKWGGVHRLTMAHPFGGVKILKPLFGMPSVPAPGGRHTVIALNHNGVTGNFEVGSGAALRQVTVPGEETAFVLAGGQAGQPRHPHSQDQFPDWLVNRQHRTGATLEQARAGATASILLKPGGKTPAAAAGPQ